LILRKSQEVREMKWNSAWTCFRLEIEGLFRAVLRSVAKHEIVDLRLNN
jgi:hypothetical protein